MNMIEELFGLAVASAPTKALKIYQADGSVYTTRLSLNVLLIAPFGATKSSFLNAVETTGYGVKVDEYSLPAIIGTIKKSGEVVKGFVTKSAGKVLLIDEFQKFGKREKEALLSLMEDHQFTRTLGYKIAPPVHIDEEFYSLHGEENYFTLKVRNAFIIATMEFKKRTIEDKALLSRAFPLVLNPSKEDAYGLITRGTSFKLPKAINDWYEKAYNATVELPLETGEYLATKYKELTENTMLELGFITRGMMDIARIAGMIAVIDGRTQITKDDINHALKYVPIQILGYNLGYLTPAELEVYSIIAKHPEGIRQKQIINHSTYSKRAVIDAIATLLGTGIIKQVKMGKAVYYYSVGGMNE